MQIRMVLASYPLACTGSQIDEDSDIFGNEEGQCDGKDCEEWLGVVDWISTDMSFPACGG